MLVTVEGIVTSIEEKEKDDKKFTELMIAQKGERIQVLARIPGHVASQYSVFEVVNLNGRLITWKTRDGIGMMLMCDEERAKVS